MAAHGPHNNVDDNDSQQAHADYRTGSGVTTQLVPALLQSPKTIAQPPASKIAQSEHRDVSAECVVPDDGQHVSASGSASGSPIRIETPCSGGLRRDAGPCSGTISSAWGLMEAERNITTTATATTTPTSLVQHRMAEHPKPRPSLARLMTAMVQQEDQCTVQEVTASVPQSSAAHVRLRAQPVDEDHVMTGLIGPVEVDLHSDRKGDCDFLSSLAQERLSLAETQQPLGITKLGSYRYRSSNEAGLNCRALKKNRPRMRRRPKQMPAVSRSPSGLREAHLRVNSMATTGG